MVAAPDDSFDFVAGMIDPTRPDVAGHAAMALAESRTHAAFELLTRKWDDTFVGDLRGRWGERGGPWCGETWKDDRTGFFDSGQDGSDIASPLLPVLQPRRIA